MKFIGKKFLKQIRDKQRFKAELREVYSRQKSGMFMKDLSEEKREEWQKRIDLVKKSEDTKKIILNSGSAKMEGNHFIMHNGIKIRPLSYYGYPMLQLLHENNGVHEPQEEYVFQEVLKEMPKGATMVELGAYWSFYSMWFNKVVQGGVNFMLEPWEIEFGKENFKLNCLEGEFFQYYIAEKVGVHKDGTSITSIDAFVKDRAIKFIDILHSDIQGNELKMLQGAKNILSNNNVGYIFVSTHSNELHAECRKFLTELKYVELCSADMEESFSGDGLLVFKNPSYPGIEKIEISKNLRND